MDGITSRLAFELRSIPGIDLSAYQGYVEVAVNNMLQVRMLPLLSDSFNAICLDSQINIPLVDIAQILSNVLMLIVPQSGKR